MNSRKARTRFDRTDWIFASLEALMELLSVSA
jgi:hypothetical protein